jgi:Protein of unknown function (DUF1826)
MRHDLRGRPAAAPIAPSLQAREARRQRLGSGAISTIPRTLEPFIADALDAVPAERLPNLRIVGPVHALPASVRRGLLAAGFGPGWLADWLVEDVTFLARLFQELTGASDLLVRLEAVDNDGCARFHTDNVRFRLISTYRGPGTQWIDPGILAEQPAGNDLSDHAVRQFDRGSVAIMRGGKDATPDCPGVLHRSPPIEGTGVTRLFLAIDEPAARNQ